MHIEMGFGTMPGRIVLFCLLLISNICRGEGSNILVLFPHASESHFGVLRTLVTELASRDHNVTVYSTHGLGETLERVTEKVVPEYAFWNKLQEHAVPKGTIQDLSGLPFDKLHRSLASVGSDALNHFLSQEAVQALIRLPDADFDFDAIILDLFYSEALLALGYARNRPTIGIISSDFGNYMDVVQESIVPAACSPIDFEQYTPDLSFMARLGQIRSCIARRKQFAKDHYGAQQQLISKHFKFTEAPSIPELQAYMALLLLNNHVPLLTPRPLLQQIVPAGGLHIRGHRELPWNIKRFMEESRIGVIYMQLGDQQLCGQVPKDRLKMLFEFLGARKERVVWTCHDVTTIEGLPKNVLIQHAVPQIDILAHPHVRAFIMNGDLLGLQEGIVRHVPILGLPIFGNERRNLQIAVNLGVGIQLDYENVTISELNWALEELMTNQKYQLKIREASAEYRDRPLGALASAMFWVNYVLRHKGGSAIKTRGVGISSCQLHLFDLFIFYFGVAVVSIGLLAGILFVAVFVWQKKGNNAEKRSKLS